MVDGRCGLSVIRLRRLSNGNFQTAYLSSRQRRLPSPRRTASHPNAIPIASRDLSPASHNRSKRILYEPLNWLVRLDALSLLHTPLESFMYKRDLYCYISIQYYYSTRYYVAVLGLPQNNYISDFNNNCQ